MTVNQVANLNSAYRNLYVNQTSAAKSLQKLSSGYRINSAADDAAGLAISEKMRGQIGGLSKAAENVQGAANLAQTAEGALDTSVSILRRMKELATQSVNGTYSPSDRALLDQEFTELKDELTRISTSTNYNGISLLDGSFDRMFQVGANGTADQQISLKIGDVSSTALSLDNFDISSVTNANDALAAIDTALNSVLTERSRLGAFSNRLEYTANNIGVTRQNLIASESTIRDVDMAKEILNFTQKSVQMQASQIMMAQGMNLTRQYMLGLLMR